MKKCFLSATCVALALMAATFTGDVAKAQGPAPRAASPQGVATIDLSFVFKNHTRFQGLLNQMKADVEQREAELRAIRDRIKAKAESINQYNVGSPEYKKLEAEITQMQADLQVQVQLQKKEFLEREAKIYYASYREVMELVKFFAERNNIAMVIRFNRETADSPDPQKVMAELNKTIVYSHPGIDITDIILEQVNRQAGPPSGGAPAAPSAMRPAPGQQGLPPRR